MRTRSIVIFAALLCSGTAFADRPDGLDCDRYADIPLERCAHWKQLNADGQWWCHWDHHFGKLDGVFGFHGTPVEPGLDITTITRDTARSDAATRALLEAYGRNQIRDHEDVFGLKPHGYELGLVDFSRRPSGAHRVAQADGSVTTESLPAVTAIRYQQMVKNAPLLEATLELQVDDENRLVSAFSTLVGDVPTNLPKRRVSQDAAIATVAIAEAPGIDFSLPENTISAIPAYSLLEDAVVPTFEVFISVEGGAASDETIEESALVDGRSGAIVEVLNTAEGASDFPGFSDGSARLFVDHPPFEVSVDTPAGSTTVTSPTDFTRALQTVPIHHLRTPLAGGNFRLADGRFARVENHRFANWESPSGEFIIPNDLFSMLVDFTPYDSDVADNCKNSGSNGPFPDDTQLSENDLWESRLDEVSAYNNVDLAATYFFQRYGFQLGRSSEAKPSLHVKVEMSPQDAPAYFARRIDIFGAHPIIIVHHGWCWRIVNGGNDVHCSSAMVRSSTSIPSATSADIAMSCSTSSLTR